MKKIFQKILTTVSPANNKNSQTGLYSIVIAIIMAIAVGMVLISLSGANPFTAYGALLRGAFGSWNKTLETFVQSIPLIGVGLAISIGFTGGVFNIGVEGQFLFGAVICGIVGYMFPDLPGIVYIPLLIIVSLAAGAFWTIIPALAKMYRGVHEVISTIMMNYVGLFVVHYMVYQFFKVPGDTVATEYLSPGALIPKIFPGSLSRLSYSFIFILAAAVLLYLLLNKSTIGYEIRATGLNREASLYSGIPIKKTMLLTFLLSGALAGLAGGFEIMGLHGRYYDGFAVGYGFAGIPIALLARRHPLGVIIAGIFMGALKSGSLEMQIIAGVPKQLVDVIQGLIIVFIAGERGIVILRELFTDKISRANEIIHRRKK
jgi:general nucleoside transport system permease protein